MRRETIINQALWDETVYKLMHSYEFYSSSSLRNPENTYSREVTFSILHKIEKIIQSHSLTKQITVQARQLTELMQECAM